MKWYYLYSILALSTIGSAAFARVSTGESQQQNVRSLESWVKELAETPYASVSSSFDSEELNQAYFDLRANDLERTFTVEDVYLKVHGSQMAQAKKIPAEPGAIAQWLCNFFNPVGGSTTKEREAELIELRKKNAAAFMKSYNGGSGCISSLQRVLEKRPTQTAGLQLDSLAGAAADK